MLNQTAEYALRAITCMAHEPGRFLSASELSETTRVPPDYMAKVLRQLAATDLVIARRGMNGGYSLGRDRVEITLLEVINAISPVERISTCPMGIKGHAGRLCPLHTCLDRAMEQIEAIFGGVTLDDVVAGRQPGLVGGPLCDPGGRSGIGQGVTRDGA